MKSLRMSFLKLSAVVATSILLSLKHTHQATIHEADDEPVTSSISSMTSSQVSMASDESTVSVSTDTVFLLETTVSSVSPPDTAVDFTYGCVNVSDTTIANVTIHPNCSIRTNPNTTTQHPEADDKPLKDYTEYKIFLFIRDYFVYFTSVPGFFTNPLCILVSLNVKPFRTSELYMMILGIADWVHVVCRFLVRQMSHYNVPRSDFICKLIFFIGNFTMAYSNMILVAWTVERFIAVVFPMRLTSWCTMKNTRFVLSCLFILIFGLSAAANLSEVDLRVYLNGNVNLYLCQYSDFYYKYWAHIESVYYIYIPMIVVCGCNFIILHKVRVMNKARIQMAGNQEIVDKRTKEQRQMTILLISISTAFVILHIPMILVVVFGYLYDSTKLYNLDRKSYAQYVMLLGLGYCITEFQNSINFFLYCLTGTKFRTTFKRMICRCRAQPKSVTSAVTNSTGIKSISEFTTN